MHVPLGLYYLREMTRIEHLRPVVDGRTVSLADSTLRTAVRDGDRLTLTLELWDESRLEIVLEPVLGLEEILSGDVDTLLRREPSMDDPLVARVQAALGAEDPLVVFELVDAHDRACLRAVTGPNPKLTYG